VNLIGSEYNWEMKGRNRSQGS